MNSSISTITFSFPDAVKVNSSSSISSTNSLKSSVVLSSSAKVTLSGKSIVGSSFTGRTVKVKILLSVYSPSVTDTLIITSPLKSSAGIMVNTSSDTFTLTSDGESLNALKTNSSPSISSADKVITMSVSSLV